jgi:hypothetical protein
LHAYELWLDRARKVAKTIIEYTNNTKLSTTFEMTEGDIN